MPWSVRFALLVLVIIALTASCLYNLLKAKKEVKKALFLAVLLVVICLRFGPFLFGLEWRASFRIPLDIFTGIMLVLWSIAWIFVEKGILKRLPVLLTAYLAVYMLGYRYFFPVIIEHIIEENGIASYVRENDDPGSLANVRFYQYENEVFRGLRPDSDAFIQYFDK